MTHDDVNDAAAAAANRNDAVRPPPPPPMMITTTTTRINIDQEEEEEDDDDEFAHLSFDFDDTNNNNNNNTTNNNTNNTSPALFDLQMTIAAMQTEHDVSIQRLQQQNQQQLRLLQNEIRKLHNETNVLRNTANQNRQNQHNTMMMSSSSNKSNSNSTSNAPTHPTSTSGTTTTTTTNHPITHHQRYTPPPVLPLPPSLQPQPSRGNTSHTTRGGTTVLPPPAQPGWNLWERSNAISFPTPSTKSFTTTNGATVPISHQQDHNTDPILHNNHHDHHQHNIEYHHSHVPNHHPHPNSSPSTGQRLIHQLLRQKQPPPPPPLPAVQQQRDDDDATISMRLIHMDIASSSFLSEWDVLHWFMMEIVTELQPPPQLPTQKSLLLLQSLLQWFNDALLLCSPWSYHPNIGITSPGPTTTTTDTFHHQQRRRRQNPRPSSIRCCRRRPTSENTNGRMHRPSDLSTSDTTGMTEPETIMYTWIEQQLSHPLLWSSSTIHNTTMNQPQPQQQSLHVINVEHDDDPNVVLPLSQQQQHSSNISQSHPSYYVQRFILDGLFQWYDLRQLLIMTVVTTFQLPQPMTVDDVNHDSGTPTPMSQSDVNSSIGDGTVSLWSSRQGVLSQISILAMQISSLFVSNACETITSPLLNSDQYFRFPDHCCDCLFINILHIGNSILLHHPQHRKHSHAVDTSNRRDVNSSSNSSSNITTKPNARRSKQPNSNVVPPPLRLVHVEYMHQVVQSKHQGDSYIGGVKSNSAMDQTVFKDFDESDALSWMTEALNLLQLVIWKKTIRNVHLSPLALDWIQTKRTGALMGMVLDVLEYTVLPNMNLYTHPFTMTCVRWMHRLIEEPLALLSSSSLTSPQDMAMNIDNGMFDDIDDKNGSSISGSSNNYTTKTNHYYWRLLRTQNVTTDSTAEQWHTSPTAINILLQIFTRIVLHQMSHDHIPSEAELVIPFLPLRDAIIRFMHGILLHVQKDRQLWEQQHYRMKQLKAVAPKTATKKRMRPILSFTIVLAEQVEIYKSMITILLSSNNPASVDNCDCGITNSYYSLNEDLYAMLKLQLEEITDDQYEKLQHG